MPPDAEQNNRYPCPACGESVLRRAARCRFCGVNISEIEEEKAAAIERPLYSGPPATIASIWQWLPVVLTLGIWFFVFRLQAMSVRFEITTQRIKIERGIFTRRRRQIELFTVERFDLYSTVGMRAAGYAILTLYTSDRNDPRVRLYGIPDIEPLSDTLRECALRERRRRRVTALMKLDQ